MNIFKRIKLLEQALHDESIFTNKLEEKLFKFNLKIIELENPAKYKVGQKVNCKQHKEIEYTIIEVQEYDMFNDDRFYKVFDGENVFREKELSLSKIKTK